jgi:hypothetical protein
MTAPSTPTRFSRRLNQKEIGLVRMLFRRAERLSQSFGVALTRHERRVAAPLWRRGIVNCWYRQAPDTAPSLQGPYFTLSALGQRLAAVFTRPRTLGRRDAA